MYLYRSNDIENVLYALMDFTSLSLFSIFFLHPEEICALIAPLACLTLLEAGLADF